MFKSGNSFKRKISLSTLLLGLILPVGSLAATAPPVKLQPAELLEKLFNSNSHFVDSHRPEDFSHYLAQQHPGVTMLGCADSRVHSNSFITDATDQIFTVRNIGNQLQNAFGSVDYGIHHLQTPVLLILGHSHCGAIRAALENYANEDFSVIAELDHLTIPLRPMLREQASSPSTAQTRPGGLEAVWAEATERNVDYQVMMALRRYRDEVKTGHLTVVGAVYDFVNTYGSSQGRLVLVNLNGATDAAAIRRMPQLSRIPAELRELTVRRITAAESTP